jgi:hypothetical protein
MSTPVKTWYYALPSGKDMEWAEIVITSTGMFAAVSDWGDYAYVWRHTGCKDVREFFAGKVDGDYFARKLAHGARVYNPETTLCNVKEMLNTLVKDGDLTPEKMEEELEVLEDCGDLDSEHSFSTWLNSTLLECDPYELSSTACYEIDNSVVNFCERIMPRLAKKIDEELDSE